MARTVNAAFTQFLAESINLDAGRSDLAKSSRNWLVDRLHEFPSKDSYFPILYSEKDTFFGSFDRKTKKRPLDDIDLMTCLTAMGAFYIEYIDRLEITVPDTSINLKKLCHDHSMILNSIRVINKFISFLGDIPQYEKADIKRNYEAATLQLSSYEWNFDIVPCFFTVPDIFGKTYYVIPDGKGHWKKTDPRIDKNRVTTVNQNHEGRILNIIRIVKYWNRRPTMPSIPSYLLENMILDFYQQRIGVADHQIDLEVLYAFEYLRNNIHYSVQDPKGIQGDLNTLSPNERIKISSRCYTDSERAREALKFKGAGDHRKSIDKWQSIFGDKFPIDG